MVITKEHWLPSEEELTVEEVKIGTPALRAGSFQYGKYCEDVNNEFMLCRLEEKDPRKCLGQGKEVTACALKFFRLVKKHCQEEFHQYANCIDKSSVDLNPR
ncbi:unnamed protein product [Darwinula stevensoni]|uniref:NADH dehydrogenase [ubiquinone] 1 alpha subcomplex subunit 8 n=1 Tax=Darwinula stevensoni TaxID=69355 RepID=A0A7R9ACF8_9CRUS|nr:unnamed protein product [Darwinula stevensoni]CAG0899778.1 unnamed protein product [Darwinula stevensoni]